MEISKENVFKVEYTPILSVGIDKPKKRTRHIIKFIKKNKILAIAGIVFIGCVCLNFMLIYNFLRILSIANYQ